MQAKYFGGVPETKLEVNVGGRSAMTDNTETAILAGGCFWGMQELLRHRDGVISTRVGYAGGENENPTEGNHPGHAEAVEIVFDPERTSYRDILEFFFQIHDPTTKDRQGKYTGSDYRSEIFYTTDEQRQVAEETTADVEACGLWPGKVVTEISAARPFWEAEAEDQDYLQHYPDGYTCHFPRPGWKLPHRETAA
jgi:peptide-methionine (S)-S-oxide reductase